MFAPEGAHGQPGSHAGGRHRTLHAQAQRRVGQAPRQRLRASFKLLDYNPKRDFVGPGGDEFLPLAGMPAFTHLSPLGRGGPDAQAISVADCESGLNTRASSPSGTNLGLWQFTMKTWQDYGGSGDPRDSSAYTQTSVAWRLYQQQGWSPWGGCAG